jgi:putative flippase GtrA
LTLARYILVQIVAYGLDLGGFYALFSTGIASPVVANIGGKLLAGVFAFFAHRSFTFGVQGPEQRIAHAVKYFTLLAINTPVSSAILAGLLLFMSHVTAAKVIADVLSVGLTFVVTKHVVFTRTAPTPPAGAPMQPPEQTKATQRELEA